VLASRTPGPILAFLTRPIQDPRPLLDDDVLPALGGLRVVHTPGHTPGSICLYSPATKVLFSGDVLQLRHGRLAPPHQVFSDDLAEARRSVMRLAELDVDTICFAHYPPLRGDATAALRGLMEAWV
jgi:glyoxylase-like metal-dependent hydrolase (beta-lactamase superfamily II)